MNKLSFILLTFLLLISCNSKKENTSENNLNKYVDPFIGTAFTGHTFPCATYPFGMVQAGPQTGNFAWEYCPGYVHEDSIIQGFTQTRLNGTGCIDLGDLFIQPFSGEKRQNYDSKFDKKTEKASPGFYEVSLIDNKVDVKITTSPHVSFYKYKFADNQTANIFADFQSGLIWKKDTEPTRVIESDIKFESDKIISGYIYRTEWADRKIYFVMEFDKPIASKELLPKKDEREKAPRYIVSFDKIKNGELNMKVALSITGIDGARNNLKNEMPNWNFDEYLNKVQQRWNKELSKIEISGDDSQKQAFYTSMYHAFIQPNNIADIDGKYVGPDNNIHQSETGKFYSTLSQWDIFRAAFPLYTITNKDLVPDLINSLVSFSQQKGHLPIWGLWGQETYTMIANHSIPMIVDAYLKGFKGFDPEKAYNEIKKSITISKHPKSDWDTYDKYGYYPYDIIKLESVSRTLECGFDDYCASLMAKKLNKNEDYKLFSKRSEYYKNLLDPETKLMRPKDSKGKWLSPFDPFALAHADSDVGGHYTEANALQYTWQVLQDMPGLINMIGNKDKAKELLDSLFYTKRQSTGSLSDVTGLIGQYSHGNEPSHHIAYIYKYLDSKHKTEELVNQICKNFYKAEPGGLIGNDDCGQMSAWYIFSTMGFYPLNPASGEFVIGAPQIPWIQINLDNGKKFTMNAINLSAENKYVEKIELNGKEYNKNAISYSDIMNGSTLVFYMTNKY